MLANTGSRELPIVSPSTLAYLALLKLNSFSSIVKHINKKHKKNLQKLRLNPGAICKET